MKTSGTMNSATGHTSVSTRTGNFNDGLYDRAGARPDLDLDFAGTKSLKDRVSKEDLITFSRGASRIKGTTYVDENGLIKKAGHNLILYSHDIGNSGGWAAINSNSGGSSTAFTRKTTETTAPNGMFEATKIVLDSGTTANRVTGLNSLTYSSSGTHIQLGDYIIFSVYLKSATNNNYIVNLSVSGTGRARVTVTPEWQRFAIKAKRDPNNSNHSVEDYKGRISIRNMAGSGTNYPQNDGSYTNQHVEIYAWGAQFENDLTVGSGTGSGTSGYSGELGELVKTTTQPCGAPRFTHDPETLESKGLLVEQQATNIIAQNTDIASIIDNTQGTDKYKLEATAYDTDTNVTNPDGTTGAARISKSANSEGTVGQIVGWRFQHESFTSPYFDTWAAKAYSWGAIVKAGSYFYRADASIASDVAQPTHTSGHVNGWKYYGTGVTADGGTMPFETISIFVKKGLSSEITFGHGGSSYSRAMMFNFDTETVSFDTSSNNSAGLDLNNQGNDRLQTVTAGAEKYPNGWYRLFLTIIQGVNTNTVGTGTNGIYLHFPSASYIDTTDNSTVNSPNRRPAANRKATYTSAQSVYWWGLQMEGSLNRGQGKFPTSPILTTGTSAVRSPDLASIQGDNFGTYRQNIHSGVTPNLTLDDGVTGNNTVQSITNATVTPYAALAPDGTFSAVKLQDIETSSDSVHQISYNLEAGNTSITIEANKTYTVTAHFKAGTATKAGIWLAGPDWATPSTPQQTIDLSTGTLLGTSTLISNNNATVTSVGDGWYRMSMRCTTASSLSPEAKLRIASVEPDSGSTLISYSGTPAGYFYVWGVQIEEGTSVTPYIPSTDTFTNRQSNATFVDGNGIVRTSLVNYVKYSEDIRDNSDGTDWNHVNLSVTPNNAIAPDGTLTADTPSNHMTRFLVLHYQTGGGSSFIVGENVPIVSEWQRFSHTFTVPSTGNDVRLYPLRSPSSESTQRFVHNHQSHNITLVAGKTYTYSAWYKTINGVNHVWGIQLVKGTEAGDYYKTTGTISGPPRYSHDPETLTPTGLYLEPEATNLAPYSEDFSNSEWVKNSATLTPNATTAPDGTNTASKLEVVNETDGHRILDHGISLGPNIYTYSVFIKPNTTNQVLIKVYKSGSTSANILYKKYNFDTEVITGDKGSLIVEKYSNGWYRLIGTTIEDSTTANSSIIIGLLQNNVETFTGNGESIYIWGAQIELGSVATSYIKTIGQTDGATRSADIFDSTATEVLDRANGTKPAFYTKVGGLTIYQSLKVNNQRDGSHTNFRSISFQSASSATSQFDALGSSYQSGSPRWGLYGASISGGPTTGSAAAYTVGDQVKLGIRYQDGLTPSDDENTVMCVNGTLGAIDTDHDVHSSGRVWIGSNGGTSISNQRKLNGIVNRLTIWKTPLPDHKLQRITS